MSPSSTPPAAPAAVPEITADSQVARIFEWRRGFNTIYLIDVGLRLELFRALREAPRAPDALARDRGLDARYVATWCTTAYAQSLLELDAEGRYMLAPHFDSILADPGHPRFLGGYVRLGTDVAARDFAHLPEAFRSGEVVPFQGRGEEFAGVIAESTQGLQLLTAKKIIPGLAGLADNLVAGGHLVEFGCGTGGLLRRCARAFPKARLSGIEIDPDSAAMARKRAQDEGLGERIVVGGAEAVEAIAPESVDAVAMIEVLHEISPALRPAVLAQAHRMLRPGGWLVVVDETYPQTPEEARRPEFRFPVQTGFEEMLWGNVVPTRSEQESLLRGAGFAGEIGREIVGEGFTILTARR